jgi:hypothetical protein
MELARRRVDIVALGDELAALDGLGEFVAVARKRPGGGELERVERAPA